MRSVHQRREGLMTGMGGCWDVVLSLEMRTDLGQGRKRRFRCEGCAMWLSVSLERSFSSMVGNGTPRRKRFLLTKAVLSEAESYVCVSLC